MLILIGTSDGYALNRTMHERDVGTFRRGLCAGQTALSRYSLGAARPTARAAMDVARARAVTPQACRRSPRLRNRFKSSEPVPFDGQWFPPVPWSTSATTCTGERGLRFMGRPHR